MRPRASVLLGSISGIPVYAHITLPIGLALFSQFAFRPLAWLAFVLVVLVHEAGHSVLLRKFHLPVLHVLVHGFGGECETADWITPWERSVVAWGGVLGQAFLLIIATLALKVGLWPTNPVATDFYASLTAINLLSAVINLLPLGSLDGRQAWRLPWLIALRARHAWLAWRLARARAATVRAKRGRLH